MLISFPTKVTFNQVTTYFKIMFVHRSQDIESMHKQEILSYTQNFEI